MSRPELSLIIPIYNEQEVLPELNRRLSEVMARLEQSVHSWEEVFIDDGSKDDSLRLLKGMAAAEPRFKLLSFSRNFGHQLAITAGIDHAEGDAVVVIDADLQDPPEVVQEMIAKKLFLNDTVQGWTTIMIAVALASSAQLIMIGVLGEYIGRIYEEIKRRPLYVTAERINFGSASAESTHAPTAQ